MSGKPRFVLCVCTGVCPGFAKLNIWELVNRVRLALPVEYAIVHPQLCVEDGDRFWNDYLKNDGKYVVGGCAPAMQMKLFKEAFEKNDVDMKKQFFPLDVRGMTTDEAFKKVEETIKKAAGS